jgi:hypothetical protein
MAKTTGSSAALCLALFAAPSYAADVRGAFVAGYDFGGEKIITVTFTNGDTQSIHANQGLYVGGGVSVLNDEKNLEFLGTVNFKYAGISAENGDVTWTRFPIDLLLFYRAEKFRLGGGLTYVAGPKLKVSGIPGGGTVNVDDAIGLLVQADYLMGRVAVGVRGTFVQYKAGGQTASGNGAGITFGFTF